jgi:hypothetical protein
MPPSGLDSVLAGYKQKLLISKTNSVTTVAGLPFTLIDRAGFPAAGSLNPGNTANGVVPTDATAGFPLINAFAGSNQGYISRIDLTTSAAGAFQLYDVLFWAGQTTIPVSGTTTVTLTSIPSFATRVPFKSDGSTRDWSQVEIFVQLSVAGSNHAHSTAITYTDQDGNTGATTGNISTQNIGVNRLIRAPLAAGDTGVQAITAYAVNGATSSTGSVSVIAARHLCTIRSQGFSASYGPDQTGLPEVFADSAILAVAVMDSTSSAIPWLNIEVVEA